jgi:ankyrin repeat protein
MRKIHLISCMVFFFASISFASENPEGEFRAEVYEAVKSGDIKDLQKLEKSEFGLQIAGMSDLLNTAVFYGQTEMIKYLKEKQGFSLDKDISFRGGRPIDVAIQTGKTNVIDALVNLGLDLKAKDKKGRSALLIAAGKGKTDTLKYLMNTYKLSLTDTDEKKRNVLLYTDCKNIDQMKYLIDELKVDMYSKDFNGDTILHYCANESKAYKYLLEEKKMKADTVDSEGATPTYIVALGDNTDAFDYFVSQGADPKFVVKKNGDTLLHAAARGNHDDMAEHLIVKYGLDVNAKNLTGNTPLLLNLATARDAECYKILVEKGASVTDANKDGETPLHALMLGGLHYKSNDVKISQYLVLKGANPKAKTKKGKTALDYALSNRGQARLVDYLKSVTN